MFIKEQSVVGNAEAQEVYGDKFGRYSTMVVEEVGTGANEGMLHVITTKHEYLEDGVIGERGWVDASLMVDAESVEMFGDKITEQSQESIAVITPIVTAKVSANTRRRRRR